MYTAGTESKLPGNDMFQSEGFQGTQHINRFLSCCSSSKPAQKRICKVYNYHARVYECFSAKYLKTGCTAGVIQGCLLGKYFLVKTLSFLNNFVSCQRKRQQAYFESNHQIETIPFPIIIAAGNFANLFETCFFRKEVI